MLKKGHSVKVNKGVTIPDMEEFDITNWQGRIIDFVEEDGEHLIEIEWDSITLNNMPVAYIQKNMDEGFDFESIVLSQTDVQKTTDRDTVLETKATFNTVKYRVERENRVLLEIPLRKEENSNDEIDDDDEIDNDDALYQEILASKHIKVDTINLKKYYNYIIQRIIFPCMLTGIESMGYDFGWEERYDFGYGSQKERDAYRKNNPSYTDTFELLEFLHREIKDYGAIPVRVRRVDDHKFFILRLDELKAEDETSDNYTLLNDFSIWAVNY